MSRIGTKKRATKSTKNGAKKSSKGARKRMMKKAAKIAKFISALSLTLGLALVLNSCAADYKIYYYTKLTNMSQNAVNNIYLGSHIAAEEGGTFHGTEAEAIVWFNEKCDILEAEDFAPSANVLEDSTAQMNLISQYTTTDFEEIVMTRQITFFAKK